MNSDASTNHETIMKKLTAISACAAALLFPSCIQWAIGENIREAAQWRFAVDVTHRYRCEGDKTNTTIVPEVRFHASHKVVDIEFPEATYTWPYGYEYTGRYRILIEALNQYGYRELNVGELYDVKGKALYRLAPQEKRLTYRADTKISSAGDKAQVAAIDGQDAVVDNQNIHGNGSTHSPRGLKLDKDNPNAPTIEKGPYYRLASVAAAPFDYFIDPVLELISAPLTPIWIFFFF